MKKLDNKDPILLPQKVRPIHICPKCGHSLIRGPGISLCENLACDSPPQIVSSTASLEAWAGL